MITQPQLEECLDVLTILMNVLDKRGWPPIFLTPSGSAPDNTSAISSVNIGHITVICFSHQQFHNQISRRCKRKKMFLPNPSIWISNSVSRGQCHLTHPQEVFLSHFSLYVHTSGLKPNSFHFLNQINIQPVIVVLTQRAVPSANELHRLTESLKMSQY